MCRSSPRIDRAAHPHAGQHATGKQRHSDACITDRCDTGCGTHASGKLSHHACDTGTRLHSDVLGVGGELHHFPTQVAGHRLCDVARCSRIILFQLPQADQRFLQVVVGEVVPACCELLESIVRCPRGLYQRFVKSPQCISELLPRLGTANADVARRSTDHGADNIPDCSGVDPSLL